jgi:SAM-dependent methyltransferase
MAFFSKVCEFLYLVGLNVFVKVRSLWEFIQVASRYYLNFRFLKIDLSLLLAYLFRSPFTVSKQFLKQQGSKEIYAYGETPLTTLELIARRCQLTKDDTFFELGCGRGRTCFWLNCWIGCKVVGIEYIPLFVEKANHIKQRFQVDGVEFRCEDILEASFDDATVLYIYGTCFDDSFIEKLIEKISVLPSGTKIITVSYSLADYTSKPIFEVLNRFPAQFTWGEADVYYQVVK